MRRFKTAAEIAAKIPDEGRAAAAMRREAAEVWSEMAALVDGPGEMQADDNRRYDALMRVHDDLTAAVAARDAADGAFMAAQRAAAGVVPPGGIGAGAAAGAGRSPVLRADQSMRQWAQARNMIPAEHDTGADRPMEFGRFIRGMVTGNWQDADVERAAMRESTSVPGVFNAMSEGVVTGGGYLVPTILSTQLVDLARARTRVLEAGAQVVPMANSTVDLAKWAGDPTAAWHSENALVTPSDAVLSRLRLQAHSLMAIVQASRELVEDSTPESLDVALRESFAASFALTIDAAAMYGTGVSPAPTGIKFTSGVTVTPMAANGAALTSWDSVVNGVYAVRGANESPTAVIWSPRTAKSAALLRESPGTGQYLAPPAYLDGVPRLETNQVPNNLTVGTSGATTSDIFTGDFRQLLVGIRTDLTIGILAERYAEFGQVGFVAWFRGDIGVARPAAFNVTTGVL